jgi:hypothetical protein
MGYKRLDSAGLPGGIRDMNCMAREAHEGIKLLWEFEVR